MNKTIEKIYKEGGTNCNQFRKVSDYIVEHYVKPYSTPEKGYNLSKEALATISECSSIDMAIGAAFKKKEYTINGIIIGVAGVIITTQIIKIFKKEK